MKGMMLLLLFGALLSSPMVNAQTNSTLQNKLSYPVTKKMSNPLFVDLGSSMYGIDSIGHFYSADPSAHVWTMDGKERLYVYASHDMEPARGCDRMDCYHVFSTDDMVNWTDHGEILNAADVRREGGWGIEGFMWAPDCAYNPANKTYYFYFPHPEYAADGKTHIWRVGVATSLYPDRDFKLQGYIKGTPSLIDPCIFVDDDGQPYIYVGGSSHRCFGGKLQRNDWTQLDGEMVEMTGLGDFHEATWIHKYKGKYYLSHSDNNNYHDGNRMKYAISDTPLGPWKDMGIYMYPTGVETNHGSIVEFKGKWYAFYHTGNYSGRGNLRSVCVDEIEYNEDGTLKIVQNYGTPYKGIPLSITPSAHGHILEAEHYNKGGYHYAYFKHSNTQTEGKHTYRPTDQLMNMTTQNGITYLDGMQKGEWARYTIHVEQAGQYHLDCFVASVNGKEGCFHICANGTNLTGEVIVNGANTDWQTIRLENIELQRGEQYLDLRIDAGVIHIDKIVLRYIARQIAKNTD